MTADEAINLHCNIKLCSTVFLLFTCQTHEPGNKSLYYYKTEISPHPLCSLPKTVIFYTILGMGTNHPRLCLGVPDAERLKVSDFKKGSDGRRMYTGTQYETAADDEFRSSEHHPSILTSYPLGRKISLCAQMVNFTGAFQSKDLLITFVLQSFYIANSLESNKITAKRSLTPRCPETICCLLLPELALPKEMSLRFSLLCGSIAADA